MSLRDSEGQASLELVGLLSTMLIVALLVWQLLLAGWTVVSASNAARTGSRVESRGGNGSDAAVAALSSPLREHARASVSGETTRVRVRVPLVVPGLLSAEALTVTKQAAMPRTAR